MSMWYQSTSVSLLLSKASFLDPRFKTLTYLSDVEKEETVNNVLQDLLANIPVEPLWDRGDNEIVKMKKQRLLSVVLVLKVEN